MNMLKVYDFMKQTTRNNFFCPTFLMQASSIYWILYCISDVPTGLSQQQRGAHVCVSYTYTM
ncbi:MAG: hypothetical protein NPIRA01_00320 [Nitrospirales bacterium]|nr:MAG: hypothetical protein NPIRA01_00320 [Nitrospirales bacterium]